MTNSFRQVRSFYKDYMHFVFRSRTMLFMIVIAASILGLAAYNISTIHNLKSLFPTGQSFSVGFSGFSYFYIAWTVTFMGGFALSNDFTRNTSTFVLALPVRRNNIFIGRFLSAITISAAVTAVLFVFMAIESDVRYGSIPSTLVSSYLLSLVLIISIMALVFLLSVLLKVDRFALIGTFSVLFIILPVLEGIFQINSINVNSLLNYDSLSISRAIGPFPSTIFSDNFISIVTEKLTYLNIDQAIISMILYFVIFLIAGIIVYRKRQIL